MSEEVVAVVTASGRAYYNIVSELKRRGLNFLSLCPGDTIRLDIKLAITTDSEKDKIRCPNILVYDGFSDPSILIDKALQTLEGKRRYKEVIVGVDPGKRIGIAVVGDGRIIKILTSKSVVEAATSVKRIFDIIETDERLVRVGNGAGYICIELISVLNKILPQDVLVESVEESGTSKPFRKDSSLKRDLKDGISALRISMRNGRVIKSIK